MEKLEKVLAHSPIPVVGEIAMYRTNLRELGNVKLDGDLKVKTVMKTYDGRVFVYSTWIAVALTAGILLYPYLKK
ncbi:MAG: hypothetical protein PHD81_00250 [Candidatus Nanoarchaeia archaeon]|nr:hypothetical protein [Candidatus Nanoarchaeia archaeon]MDD5587522.1 hypothetical protein [Candidatus Nanoarchaeia archaeon]